MTTRRKLLAQRQRQEEERSAARAAEKAAKPAEKKPAKLRVVEPAVQPTETRYWLFEFGMNRRQAFQVLMECGLPTDNADAFQEDFKGHGAPLFESDVRAWAEGRS